MRGKLTILFLVLSSSLFAQDKAYRLDFEDTPISDVLVFLRDEYGFILSYNPQILSKYKVSIQASFSSEKEVLESLLSDIPFLIETEGEVFIIREIKEQSQDVEYRLSVSVIDASDGETLPFAHVKVNEHSLTTDYVGMFSTTSRSSSTFDLMISYMGYYVIDTVLTDGDHIIEMMPATIHLKEIVIEGGVVDDYSGTGDELASIRLNQKVASYLPGNGDNSIFNLLRLQPGILAAGEQSGDIIIWGSYQGQSKMDFDGFTIFGLNNFTDNMSTVNPFAVKDIQVLKAGYGAEEEGRVGGVVRISGFEGLKSKPQLKFNINNQTINGFLSIPIFKSTALSLAYRETYLDLLDDGTIIVESSTKLKRNKKVDLTLDPNYKYRDLNLKYAGKFGSNRFSISLFKAIDNFDYLLNNEFGQSLVEVNTSEDNDQWAGSLFFNRNWKSRHQTKVLLSSSNMETSSFDFQIVEAPGNNPNNFNSERTELNRIQEQKFQLSQYTYWGKSNLLKTGFQYINDELKENILLQGSVATDDNLELSRLGYFLENEWNKNNWKFRLGGRIDHLFEIDQTYFQPRFSGSYEVVDQFKVSASWGVYNQFLQRNSVIDERGNLRYKWDVSNGIDIPVLESQHLVTGLSGFVKGFNWKFNVFYKTTKGLSRYLESDVLDIYNGDSKSTGSDIYLGKEIKGHKLWASYTLSNTKEYFNYFSTQEYQRALQDQRHEIKGAVLFDLSPFYFSLNYVYGSGLPDPAENLVTELIDTRYSRFDISGRIKIRDGSPYIESGINILNLFNTQNIKFDNIVRLPDADIGSISVHSESVPFTATLFAKIIF